MLFPTYLSGCKCQLIKDGEPHLFANLNTTSQQTRGKGRDIWDGKYRISGLTFCRGETA